MGAQGTSTTETACLTTKQVADRLQVSAGTVRRLAKEKRLLGTLIGRWTYRYLSEDVDAFLKRCQSPLPGLASEEREADAPSLATSNRPRQ